MAKVSKEMQIKILEHAILANEAMRDQWYDKAIASNNQMDKALALMMAVHHDDEIEKDRKLLTEIKEGSDGLDTY